MTPTGTQGQMLPDDPGEIFEIHLLADSYGRKIEYWVSEGNCKFFGCVTVNFKTPQGMAGQQIQFPIPAVSAREAYMKFNATEDAAVKMFLEQISKPKILLPTGR